MYGCFHRRGPGPDLGMVDPKVQFIMSVNTSVLCSGAVNVYLGVLQMKQKPRYT